MLLNCVCFFAQLRSLMQRGMVQGNLSDCYTKFGADSLHSFALNIPTKCYIPARTSLKGTVKFNSQGSRGRFQDRMELMFSNTVDQRQFAIVKPVHITVGNRSDHEQLQPVSPYIPKKKTKREQEKDVIEGSRPRPIAAVKWVKPLPEYPIPKPLQTILDIPSMKDRKRLLQTGFVSAVLSSETHARRFHVLLLMEEHQSE
jgi:helicase MOV-10